MLGETVETSTFYGPDTSIFDPALGEGVVRAVGSYQYAESPAHEINHGMLYEGLPDGIGLWFQIDVSSDGTIVVNGIVLSGTVEDTILHSTQGDLIVGNYDMYGPGGTLNGGSATVMSGGVISGATISSGTLEIQSGGGVQSSTITFAGSGSLVLDDTKFRGKIAGLDSPAETVDLTTVNIATASLGYTGNTLSGTLAVTDGTHTARLAILGQYTATSFHLAGDGNGGTLVFDPPVDSSGHLAQPGHA